MIGYLLIFTFSVQSIFVFKILGKHERLTRDLKAINTRLNNIELVSDTKYAALDFTLRTVIAERCRIENTAFNLKAVRKSN